MTSARVTRRDFLASAASAGAFGIASVAKGDLLLDEAYTQDGPPGASVSYPSTWTLNERLVSNIVIPIELFSLSSEPLTPQPDLLASLPDYTALSPDGVLVTVRAVPFFEGEEHLPGLDVSGGVRFDNLALATDDDTYPAIDKRRAWYEGTAFGYEVLVFSGRGSPDLDLAASVVNSIRL